ncbi:MAG: pseudaminic acid cytidylyltransferase [Gemmatimonadaceae bacterium]
MNLAVITARGGSKRIPRKNMRSFCGKPIMGYSIQAALAAGCFDQVMVSTDDDEIAQAAQAWGALVPFMRSRQTASDYATTAEVLLEVLEEYRRRAVHFEAACCIYPTAPFVTGEALARGLRTLLSDPGLSGTIPVVRFSYPIQRALRITENRVSLFQPEHLTTRSQDLEPAYHDAGQFYWVRVSSFLKAPSLINSTTAAIVLPEWQVQDIDNDEDWVMAEMKYRLMQEQRAERNSGGRS